MMKFFIIPAVVVIIVLMEIERMLERSEKEVGV